MNCLEDDDISDTVWKSSFRLRLGREEEAQGFGGLLEGEAGTSTLSFIRRFFSLWISVGSFLGREEEN